MKASIQFRNKNKFEYALKKHCGDVDVGLSRLSLRKENIILIYVADSETDYFITELVKGLHPSLFMASETA